MPKYLMPVGNTDFKEIRETGLYYIDKTMLIDQLVGQSAAKVTLFTRPRRFGKSLNMSMICPTNSGTSPSGILPDMLFISFPPKLSK